MDPPQQALLTCNACNPQDSLPELLNVTVSALQCEGQFRKKMVFRPADLDSKHHKRLSQAVERHHVKVARVKKTVTTQDPAKAKVEHPHKGVFTEEPELVHQILAAHGVYVEKAALGRELQQALV